MKKILTTLAGLLIAFNASNAQSISYSIDNSFNTTGYMTMAIPNNQNTYAGFGACLLYNDGKMYTAHHFIQVAGTSAIPSIDNIITKRKANGAIDSSFSSDGVQRIQTVGITEARVRELYKLSNNGFYATTEATFGGFCTNNDSDTGLSKQLLNSTTYLGSYNSSVKIDANNHLQCMSGEIYSYQNNGSNNYTSTNYFSDGSGSFIGTWGKVFPACFYDANNGIVNTENPYRIKLGLDNSNRLLIAASNYSVASTTVTGTHLVRMKPYKLNDIDSSFGTNGKVTLGGAATGTSFDWLEPHHVSAIKVLSDNSIIVAYKDFANNNYKVIKLNSSGIKSTSFGNAGAITSASYIHNVIIDAQDNIFINHDSTLIEAYNSNGAPLSINGNSNKIMLNVAGFSNIKLINHSMNDNGDILLCGYKNGTVYSANTSGYGTDALLVKLKRTSTAPNAINSATKQSKLDVYPNPATTTVNIADAQTQVAIYNIYGTKVISTKGGTINIEQLTAGQYIVKANNETTRFIKQ
jgi:hypothetical protein